MRKETEALTSPGLSEQNALALARTHVEERR
jgi:hypothetical protein